NWCYDRHCSVRLVICFDLAIDQIAQSGLSSLKVIYYSAQLFRCYLYLSGISFDRGIRLDRGNRILWG
ncbi:hypothetical protein E5F65_24410, partial [Shigella sonnei]